MAERVDLHVGLPKTGTTSLQRLLFAHRDALAAADVHLVVDSMRVLFRAARDLGHGREHEWADLVRAIHRTPGRVVISCEGLSAVPADQAARALADVAPAEIRIVVTVRDLVRVVPSVWQQHIRTGSTIALADFVAEVRDGIRWAWLPDTLEVLDAWGSRLPADRVHVVTVPPKGSSPSSLWERFAAACDLESSVVESTESADEGDNVSLGAAQIELLRRVNGALGDRRPIQNGPYRDLIRPLERATSASGIASVLAASDHDWAVRQSRELVAELEQRGYPVSGDLADLVPTDGPPGSEEPLELEEVLDLAARVTAEALLEAKSLRPNRPGSAGRRGDGPGARQRGRGDGPRAGRRPA